jgi:hypothetical protein
MKLDFTSRISPETGDDSPIVDTIFGKIHVPMYYFLYITFKKLYFKDGTTVSQVQLNQEKEQ